MQVVITLETESGAYASLTASRSAGGPRNSFAEPEKLYSGEECRGISALSNPQGSSTACRACGAAVEAGKMKSQIAQLCSCPQKWVAASSQPCNSSTWSRWFAFSKIGSSKAIASRKLRTMRNTFTLQR